MIHSEEYLQDDRLEWYNPDFLELMARRWSLGERSVVADVGCGLCHWSRLLLPHLAHPATVYGIDREAGWVERSRDLVPFFEARGAKLELIQAHAESTGLPDNCCDLVTCQTLLIHVADRVQVLREFYRILKPGGIVVCAEPNNLVNSLIQDSGSAGASESEQFLRFAFDLRYAMGKACLGQGNSASVETIPHQMGQAGFTGMKVHVSDRFDVDPVDSSRDFDAEFKAFKETEYQKAREYWLACGASALEYEEFWNLEEARAKRQQLQAGNGGWLACCGGLVYLFHGYKE